LLNVKLETGPRRDLDRKSWLSRSRIFRDLDSLTTLPVRSLLRIILHSITRPSSKWISIGNFPRRFSQQLYWRRPRSWRRGGWCNWRVASWSNGASTAVNVLCWCS